MDLSKMSESDLRMLERGEVRMMSAEGLRMLAGDALIGVQKPSPSSMAVLANATAKGVAGVPDALINIPVHVWNLGKAAAGTLATAAGRPDLAPGLTPTPNWVHEKLKGMGFIRDASEPTNSTQRILDMVGQGLGGAVAGPVAGIKQLAVNSALGAGSGMVGGVVGEVTGSPEWGAVAAMGATPGLSKIGEAANRAGRYVSSGTPGRVGRTLSVAADMPPDELAAAIRAGNITYVPGANPTTYQAAMVPGISQLKRSAQSSGADFSTAEKAQNAARVSALEGIQPGTVGRTAHEAAQNAGDVLAKNYAFQRGALKDAERGAWNSHSLTGVSFKLPADKLHAVVEQYYPGSTFRNAPSDLRALLEAADSGAVIPHAEVQKWRSTLGNMARDKFNTDPSGRAAALSAKSALDGLYKEAAKAGAQKFAVTGKGPWGAEYGGLAGDPANAVAHLLHTGQGSVPAAGVHPFYGPVELAAGKHLANGGTGVLHIEARDRPGALLAIPDLIAGGALYGRVEGGKLRPNNGNTGQLFLSDGTHEAALRDYFNTPAGPIPKSRMPNVYQLSTDRRIPLETGRSASASSSTPSTQAPKGTSSTRSIVDGYLSGNGYPPAVRELVDLTVPAPVRTGNPRSYSPGLMPPEAAQAFADANFLTRTRKQRFETGPIKGMLTEGPDGVVSKQGAEAFNALFNSKASQTNDIAAISKTFPGNDEVWNAMRQGAMADLLERSVNSGGLLSDAKLTNYTNARSGALKGLLSTDQADALSAVQRDVRRATAAEDLNRVKGSDTAQKLLGAGMLESPVISRMAALIPKIGPAGMEWLRTVIRQQNARNITPALVYPDMALDALGAYQRVTAPTVWDSISPAVRARIGLGLLGNIGKPVE